MNVLEIYVTNITKVEKGLPYNSVRIVADFDCWGHKEVQVTEIIRKEQYEQILKNGYYLG